MYSSNRRSVETNVFVGGIDPKGFQQKIFLKITF